MKREKKQGGLLLAKLQILSGCEYLSDLHNTFYMEEVLCALKRINIASYSVEEWMEAYHYITGKDCPESSRENLAYKLADWLESRG